MVNFNPCVVYTPEEMFSFDDFFSLSSFSHASLWKEGSPIWSALSELDNYFTSFSHRIEIEVPPDVFLENRELISIGEGTVIDPGVLIRGPCIIGKQASIRHGAFLRGFVVVGDRCVVGHSAELKNAILLNGAKASHLCYVGDSILGPHVNLGAGVKCSNLRLDGHEITISVEGKKIRTGLKKLGAILGEGVEVGCNAVLNPGTLVGRHCDLYPLLNVGGWIPPHSKVKGTRSFFIQSKETKILEELMRAKDGV